MAQTSATITGFPGPLISRSPSRVSICSAALAFLANFLSASSVMQSCRKKSYARSGVNRASRLRIWLAGHSTLTMAMRYMHLTPKVLREAIELLNSGHPVGNAANL